jgi:hypothetical protein
MRIAAVAPEFRVSEGTAMRSAFVAMLLATTVTPALAAPRHAEDREMARVADKLNDPRTQSAMSGMMVAMADAFMDVRVDKLRAAIARIDPEARDDRDWDGARTLGDVIDRDDPHFRDRIEDDSRMAVGTMGAMASGMADIMPELRDMGERMGRQMEKAMRHLPRD